MARSRISSGGLTEVPFRDADFRIINLVYFYSISLAGQGFSLFIKEARSRNHSSLDRPRYRPPHTHLSFFQEFANLASASGLAYNVHCLRGKRYAKAFFTAVWNTTESKLVAFHPSGLDCADE